MIALKKTDFLKIAQVALDKPVNKGDYSFYIGMYQTYDASDRQPMKIVEVSSLVDSDSGTPIIRLVAEPTNDMFLFNHDTKKIEQTGFVVDGESPFIGGRINLVNIIPFHPLELVRRLRNHIADRFCMSMEWNPDHEHRAFFYFKIVEGAKLNVLVSKVLIDIAIPYAEEYMGPVSNSMVM